MPESNEQVRAARSELLSRLIGDDEAIDAFEAAVRGAERVTLDWMNEEYKDLQRLHEAAEQRIERLVTTLDETAAALSGILTRGIVYSMLVNGDMRGYDGAKDAIDEREFDDSDVAALWDALKFGREKLVEARAALAPAGVSPGQTEKPIDETPDYVLGEHPEIDPGVLGAMQMFAAGKGEEVVEYVRTYHQCNYECSFPCTLAGI